MADEDKKVIVEEENDTPKTTTVNQEVKSTTVNQAQKQTTINEKNNGETKVNQEDAQPTDGESPEKAEDNENEGDISSNNYTPDINPKRKKIEPFKEGDVIDYMFKNWLLAGINWLCEETVYQFDKGYYKRKYANELKKANRKEEKKLESYDTYKKMMDLGKKSTDNINNTEDYFHENTALIELGAKLREGDFSGVSEDTAFMLKSLPREKFDALFAEDRMSRLQKNYNNNMIALSQFANNFARVSLVEAKMKDASSPTDEKAFENAKKEGTEIFLRLIGSKKQQGMSHDELFNYSKNLMLNMDRAADQMRENLVKGHFDGYTKTNWLGRTKKGSYKKNSAFENILAEASSLGQANGTQGIYEEIMQQQNFDKNNRDKIISFTTAREMTNNQLQSLEARRKRFLEARERIYSDPQKKANREKAEKIREQKRQQRIANLRNPQYVMKNIEGKDDPALTAAMRKYYQDRFLMK